MSRGRWPGTRTSAAISTVTSELDSSFPAEVPAHWSVYFAVEDTDAAVAKVNTLGGSTGRPAWDTPYGRMAVVADDHGAPFSLISITPADNA